MCAKDSGYFRCRTLTKGTLTRDLQPSSIKTALKIVPIDFDAIIDDNEISPLSITQRKPFPQRQLF
jgi:hypothetical protein